jgi:DNA gyrase/topoisomerase IV subunit B
MTNNPKIVIKAELDHVRQYPGMYIGNTFTPNNLIREIIDNSLDEIINDFASTITINTNDDGHAIITDNGRGIPIHNIEYNGKMHDSIVIACTKLMAGAKFDNNSYSRSVGMHGIGLKAANALSSWMRVSVKDKNDPTKIHDYQFENSDLVSKEIIDYDIDWSTRIEVQVNPKFFDSVKFIDSEIIQRLRLIKAHHKNKKIIFNDEEIEEVDIEDFIKENLLLDEELPLFKLSTEKNNSNITCYFTYDLENSPTPLLKGDVNYLLCSGTFQSTFLTLVGNTVSEMSQGSVSKADAIKYIKAYLSIQIPDPSFDSQSKHNMTKNLYDLMSLMKNDIKLLYSTQTFLKEAIVSIIEAKTLKTISKKIPKKKKRISITNPLKDAQQIPGKRLYIVEGESASGPIAAKRNSKIEGCLPLSGKILNVTKKTTEEVVDSKKFRNILEAIGIEVGKKQQQYRYEYIDVLADGDCDGLHITCLVIIGLWKYAPSLILNKRVGVILPPLYGTTINKKFIPIYTTDELKNYPNQHITRFKGLGEMNSNQMEVILQNPLRYVVEAPKNKEEELSIIETMRNTELKRRLCEHPETFNFNRLFQKTKEMKEN